MIATSARRPKAATADSKSCVDMTIVQEPDPRGHDRPRVRSDLAAFLICLTSANISFGIFVIPLHYRVFIYGANLLVPSVGSHGPKLDLSDSEVRIDLWKTLKDQRSAIKICDINEHEQARALISCGAILAEQLRGPES
jgi:hypothetical protein